MCLCACGWMGWGRGVWSRLNTDVQYTHTYKTQISLEKELHLTEQKLLTTWRAERKFFPAL